MSSRPTDPIVEARERGAVPFELSTTHKPEQRSRPQQARAPPCDEVSPKVDKLADDLLIGARAIADELGIPVHAVYHIVKKRRLPIGKLGKTLIASRAKLRRAANALTS